MTEPPHPWGLRLALLRHWQEEDRARLLLDSLNAVQKAFGFPPYSMPEPYSFLELTPEKLSDPMMKRKAA